MRFFFRFSNFIIVLILDFYFLNTKWGREIKVERLTTKLFLGILFSFLFTRGRLFFINDFSFQFFLNIFTYLDLIFHRSFFLSGHQALFAHFSQFYFLDGRHFLPQNSILKLTFITVLGQKVLFFDFVSLIRILFSFSRPLTLNLQ